MARFRPVLSAVLAAALGSVLLTGCSSDRTPSGVTIGWADNTHQAVRVSWKDSNEPNRISIEGVVSTSPSYVKYLPAAEPNTWAIPTSAFPPDGNYKIAVSAGTSSGGVTSKAAQSAMFDTDGPVKPLDARAQASGKDVVVTWKVPAPSQDFTPNDPLDLPAGRQLYLPVVGLPGQSFKVIGAGTTASRQVLKNVKPPYLFQLRATNEWSSLVGGVISARLSWTTASIPPLATYGRQILIHGRTIQQEVSCAESRCVAQRVTSAGLPIVMLTQSQAGAPWGVAGRATTMAGGHFQVRVNTGPTRSYRAYALADSRPGSLSAASSSLPGLTRSRLQVVSAGYPKGNVKPRNEVVTATVLARPVVNGAATLQFWNGKAWASVKSVPIAGGRATINFKATKPGIFAYRVLLPGTAYLGHPVFGTATGSMVLRIL
jgi:hypothetical protein